MEKAGKSGNYMDEYNAILKQASEKTTNKEYKEAIELYNKAIAFKSYSLFFSDVYFERAALKRIIKDYLGAIEDLTVVIDMDSDEPDYYTIDED
jgi:tetratricopeptide (TPR) repeat protein